MGRTVRVTAADVRQRAATAREYFQVALERLDIAPEGPSSVAQVCASNAISAAIAAADALCGRAHGYHASGQDHREAVRLVKAIPGSGAGMASRLLRLSSAKSELQYGGFCTRAVASRSVADAKVLIDELDRLNL